MRRSLRFSCALSCAGIAMIAILGGEALSQDEMAFELLWHQPFREAARAVVTEDERTFTAGSRDIVIGTGGQRAPFFALRAHDTVSGRLIWEADDTGPLPRFSGSATSVIVEDGRVCAGASVQQKSFPFRYVFTVRCYDAVSGNLLWEYQESPGAANVLVARGDWLFAAGAAFEAGSGFFVAELDAVTGELAWATRASGGRAQALALRGDRLYAGGDAYVRAYDADTGEMVWEERGPNVRDVTMVGPVLFAGGDGGVQAFDAVTGETIWSSDIREIRNVRSIVARGQRLFAGTGRDDGLYSEIAALDSVSGEVVWKSAFDRPVESVALGRRWVYGLSSAGEASDGALRAFDPLFGRLVWQDAVAASRVRVAFAPRALDVDGVAVAIATPDATRVYLREIVTVSAIEAH
ncbi:MAG: PQQ-binding-like beta-propeller repeat protein [Acidobacteriota bacterium]|nr:MAG: PQQ-binding-like beta-propeller repeat protein [Acidobacteriota bacterium]